MPRLTAPVVPAGSLNRAPQPEFRAGDLLLRPWAAADADVLLAAFTDPAIQRWHARTVESRHEAADLIARYNQGWQAETSAYWAITGPAVLGRVGFRVIDLDQGTAEIAYWVTAAARGRGTAVRAAVALSRWALDDLGLHRLDLQHAVANTASCRVADKAGYAYEATLRSSVLHADGWHDMHVHARIAGDAQVTSTTARSEDKKPRLLNLDLVPGQATRSRRGRCGAPAQHRPVRAGTARGPGRDGLTLREMSALARLDRAARPHRAS